MEDWKISNIDKAKYLGTVEFQDDKGEWHDFEILETKRRFIFGGACNVGFIESGFLEKDDCQDLSDLLSLLEDYYNYGPEFASDGGLIFNERM